VEEAYVEYYIASVSGDAVNGFQILNDLDEDNPKLPKKPTTPSTPSTPKAPSKPKTPDTRDTTETGRWAGTFAGSLLMALYALLKLRKKEEESSAN